MEDELQFDMSWKFTWPPQHLDSAALKGVPWGSGATVLGHHPKFPKSGYQTDLRPVVHSLFFHLDNLRSLLHMPTSVFHYAQMAERLALHVLSEPLPPPEPDPNIPEHILKSPEYQAFQESNKDWITEKRYAAEYERLAVKIWDDNTKFGDQGMRQFCISNTEFPRMSRSFAGHGLRIMLQAAMLNAWTAFESHATDLWVKAVDLRPRTLAKYVVQGPNEKHQEPSIQFSNLADYGFDLTSKMGQLLRGSQRVKMDSFKGIEAAYRATFMLPESKGKKPSKNLDDLLKKHHSNLKCLEAARNLLAHRGGIVDARFLEEVKGHSPYLSGLQENKPLPVNGMHVQQSIILVIAASLDLLEFVGDWLEKHPDPSPSK